MLKPSETALQRNWHEAAVENQRKSTYPHISGFQMNQVSATRHRPPTFNGFKALGVEQSMTKSTASFSWTISWEQVVRRSMTFWDISYSYMFTTFQSCSFIFHHPISLLLALAACERNVEHIFGVDTVYTARQSSTTL